ALAAVPGPPATPCFPTRRASDLDSTPGVHATTTTSNCGITIAPPAITAQCVAATTGTVGTPYSSAITVSGGTGPYTFAIATGSLTASLHVGTAARVNTGTPTSAG